MSILATIGIHYLAYQSNDDVKELKIKEKLFLVFLWFINKRFKTKQILEKISREALGMEWNVDASSCNNILNSNWFIDREVKLSKDSMMKS